MSIPDQGVLELSHPSEHEGWERVRGLAERCNQVQYHQVDQIQPHGVLLAIDPRTKQVVVVSENADRLLGVEPSTTLGSNLFDHIEASQAAELSRLLENPRGWGRCPQKFGAIRWRPGGELCSTMTFASGGFIAIEVDVDSGQAETHSTRGLWSQFSAEIATAEGSLSEVGSLVAHSVRELSGYERAYVLRFDESDHGLVCAEANLGVLPSLLNHHFPFSDIPAVVRQLYVRSRFRVTPDVNYQSVNLITADGPTKQLDLTYSSLRSTSQTHLIYQRNMGVMASGSFSVVVDGKLWGLVGIHSRRSKPLSLEQLGLCQSLVELLAKWIEGDNAKRALALHETTIANCSEVFASADDLALEDPRTIRPATLADKMLELLPADAFNVLTDEQADGFESLLDSGDSSRLESLISKRVASGDPFVTDSVSSGAPELASFAQKVSGVLALPLPGVGTLVWTRKEQIVERLWAGDPRAATLDSEGQAVGPRRSFDTWKSLVRGTSVPWHESEVQAATIFRDAVRMQLGWLEADRARRQSDEANQAKTMFLANMSHELRTPLHAVLSFARHGVEDIDADHSEDLREHFSDIRQSASRLLALVNDLLALASVETGKLRFSFAEYDMEELVKGSIKELNQFAADREVNIQLVTAGATLVEMDRDRMKQVVVNLLSNALKFAPAGSAIAVGLELPDQAAESVRVSVRDQGPGIPEAELEAIFGNFYQGSNRSPDGGTGLGLAIAREIILAHQGRIWAENDGGAKVVIEVPLRRPGRLTSEPGESGSC